MTIVLHDFKVSISIKLWIIKQQIIQWHFIQLYDFLFIRKHCYVNFATRQQVHSYLLDDNKELYEVIAICARNVKSEENVSVECEIRVIRRHQGNV